MTTMLALSLNSSTQINTTSTLVVIDSAVDDNQVLLKGIYQLPDGRA